MLFDNKGNVAAVLLIALLVLLSIAVFTFDPFIAKEKDVDYELLFSDSRSVLERSYYEQYRVALRSGLLLDYGVWYANQGYEVSTDLAEDKIAGNLSELYSGETVFKRRDSTINISSLEENIVVSLTESGFQINISDAYIEIVTGDEIRRISFDDDYVIPSQIKRLVNNFNTWLECDAGNLTSRFKKFYDSTPCQFYSCCCGYEKPSSSQFENLKNDYGISASDLDNVIDDSLNVLNKIIALNASSCNPGSLSKPLKYSCSVEEIVDVRIGNFLKSNLSKDVPCNPTTNCGFDEVSSTQSKLMTEWRDGLTNFNIWDLSPREKLHNKFLVLQKNYTYDNFASLLNSIEEEKSYLFEVALDKASSGKVRVICRSTDATLPDFQEIRFTIKFSNLYDCPIPEVSDGTIPECVIEDEEPEDNGGGGSEDCCDDCTGEDDCECGCDDCPGNDDGPDDGSDDGPDEGPEESIEACEPEDRQKCDEYYPDAVSGCAPKYTCKYLDGDFVECVSTTARPNQGCGPCTVCGPNLLCNKPANRGASCTTSSSGCLVAGCDGDNIGSSACITFPRNSKCPADSGCGGTCNTDGTCAYNDGASCSITVSGGCSYQGKCDSGGSCVASPPEGSICCGGEWCDQACCDGVCLPTCSVYPG